MDIEKLTLNELLKKQEELNKIKKLSRDEKFMLKKIEKEIYKKNKTPSTISNVFVANEDIQKNNILYINISDIVFPKYNDRSGIDSKKLEELSQSIKEKGLLQPIVVYNNHDGSYTKIAGRRRIEAHKLLGESKIQAIVYNDKPDDYSLMLLIIHENHQREDLNQFDKTSFTLKLLSFALNTNEEDTIKLCIQVKNLSKLKNISEAQTKNKKIIEKTLSDSKIFNSISSLINSFPVLSMHEAILKALVSNNGSITFKHALLLEKYKEMSFKNNFTFPTLIEEILNKSLSVKETQEFISSIIITDSKNIKIDDNKLIKNKTNSLNKIYKSLDIKNKDLFNEELDMLIKKFS